METPVILCSCSHPTKAKKFTKIPPFKDSCIFLGYMHTCTHTQFNRALHANNGHKGRKKTCLSRFQEFQQTLQIPFAYILMDKLCTKVNCILKTKSCAHNSKSLASHLEKKVTLLTQTQSVFLLSTKIFSNQLIKSTVKLSVKTAM